MIGPLNFSNSLECCCLAGCRLCWHLQKSLFTLWGLEKNSGPIFELLEKSFKEILNSHIAHRAHSSSFILKFSLELNVYFENSYSLKYSEWIINHLCIPFLLYNFIKKTLVPKNCTIWHLFWYKYRRKNIENFSIVFFVLTLLCHLMWFKKLSCTVNILHNVNDYF